MPLPAPKNSSFPMTSSRQIVDSLTSHLSLYNSSCPNPNPNPNPNPRSAIIKWFSSLSVTQRQAHLTVVDFKFTQTLLEMIRKIESNGHGCFFVLPDIPRDSVAGFLPSVLYRKSHGLLSRVAESNESERLIREGTRLFSSKEGENVKQIALLGNEDCVDTMTVSEDFVENVERFVEIMDRVSDGEFLRGEDNGGLAVEWVEMEWFKAKGYYSMEVFVANRLEVALRLAWLNSCNSGKIKGLKLKEKTHGVGLSVNVFSRKKGCIDWWRNLDKETKGKLFRIVIGKAAKCLSTEVLKGEHLRDRVWQWISKSKQSPRCKDHGNSAMLQQSGAKGRSIMNSKSDSTSSSSLNSMFNSLIILQDISSMLLLLQHNSLEDEGILFYSSVNTVTTPFDCVVRKFRELLMAISLDCTKFELLGDGNTKPTIEKQKEKHSTRKQKRKAKNSNLKKPTPMTRSPEDESKLVKPTKDNGVEFLDRKTVDASLSGKLIDKAQEQKLCREPLLSIDDKGCCKTTNKENSASASRKGKRKKAKRPSSQRLVDVGRQPTSEVNAAVRVNVDSSNKAPKDERVAEHSNVENVSSSKASGNAEKRSNSECCQCTTEGTNLPVLKESNVMDVTDNEAAASVESMNYPRDVGAPSSTVSVEYDEHLTGINGGSLNSEFPVEGVRKSGFVEKLNKDRHLEEKRFRIPEHQRPSLYDIGILNSPVYLSYEWPTVNPLQLPPSNPHLPAATDRLHLDVGHNLQNRFHQSFVPAEHRVRNSSGENGCVSLVSRPLTVSSDWPPTVRSMNGVSPSVACNYDSGFYPRRQTFQQGFSSPSVQRTAVTTDDIKLYSSDLTDFSDPKKSQELVDEHENHWMSEEELEMHAVSGMDYNQYFGGGVMYWNPSDYPGSNFSRPPSRSSDDSSWAWRDADMNRAVDDMVAFSSSYSTNGLTSPSAASFCSLFDPLGSGHQAVGYVLSDGEISSKVLHSSSATDVKEDNASGALSSLSGDGEVKPGESHPYPILRPIIIPNMSRERSRSDIKRSHDHTSPCVPLGGREHPRIKRPPSPVVLCVPHAPRPPPPPSINDSRKQRGFPTARSGSSSPRNWGVKGWSSDVISFEEACVHMDGSEVVWPSWRNKGISVHQLTQPVPGALLQDRLIAISQLARDQEHPDIALPLQPPESLVSTRKASLSVIHNCLTEEIDFFCKQVTTVNIARKPYISWAVKRVTRSLQVLWPRSRTNIFGSNATGLSLPSSDVDLVVCLPPVRNLEPIKEAGILEGRNGIKETSLQHAARYLANQEWVKNDSLKIVENTAIPIIMLVVEVPRELLSAASLNLRPSKEESVQTSVEQRNSLKHDSRGPETTSPNGFKTHTEDGQDIKSVRIDISFKSPSHTGLQTTELVKDLTGQFPAATPLALVLKKFLADRSLDQSYSGGLSSYCLVLLVVRFLQHEHHLGRPINQNYGSLLMDFLYFFGNVFDPREMRVSVQGSGVYMKREPGCSIDPIYIADPLFPTNNVGRNCFRIHQCIKAFADAYSTLESELTPNPGDDDDVKNTKLTCKLLPKIIPSIGHFPGS